MPERQTKATQQRHERMLTELLKLPGNDRCADCPTKNPRWASYSLGVFLCVRCAGLHRKMGTHISRVKSISMDQWTPEQIDNIRQQGGNAKVNSVINPHPEQHPLPLADDDNERAMEKYVRLKWEKRAFIEQPVMPSRPAASQAPASRAEPPKRTSSAPALVRDPSNYESGVARLREMGFKDDERNRQVLRQTQGSLEAAIDILSRLPGAQRPPLTNGIGLTDEQKMLRLNDLGYTDMAECRDALRRTGGNLEVAISLLQNARQSATTAQPSKPAEPLSAFSTTSAFSTSQELAGRAQNSEERQAAKLSGTPMGKLLDVDDASRAVPNVSNPFNMPLQQQQQQQQPQPQPQSSFTTTNPFGQSTPFAMMMSSSSATTTMQQPQLTGMPAASNGMAMFNVQPQQTGLQPHVSPMQPTMTGSSNPFSQMASSPSPLTSTPGTASSSPFQQHQQPQNDRYGLPQRSFTAPSFGTSPFPSSPLQQHHQLQQPQQQQPFQQQQHVQPQQTGMMMMNHGFANAVPAQPTGYQNVFGNMPPAATAASTNPWANGSTGGALF